MPHLKNSIRTFVYILMFLYLAACGGGSGSKPDQITINTNTVSFSAMRGTQAPGSTSIQGAVSDDVNKFVYIVVDASSTPLIRHARVTITGRSGTVMLFPSHPDLHGVGNHTGTIEVRACLDLSCSRQLRGSPKQITVEYEVVENPLLRDSDEDGVPDVEDDFPEDGTETVDTDMDGTGDNADFDDDNDGVEDGNDAFPLDATESLDTDGDGIGNNQDDNDDNDLFADVDDEFPLDRHAPSPLRNASPGVFITGRGEQRVLVSGEQLNEATPFFMNGVPVVPNSVSENVAEFMINFESPQSYEISVQYENSNYRSVVSFNAIAPVYFPYFEIDGNIGTIGGANYDPLRQTLYGSSFSQVSKTYYDSNGVWISESSPVERVVRLDISQSNLPPIALTQSSILSLDPESLAINESMLVNDWYGDTEVFHDIAFDFLGQGYLLSNYNTFLLPSYEEASSSARRYFNPDSGVASSRDGTMIILGSVESFRVVRPLNSMISESYGFGSLRDLGESDVEINSNGSRVLFSKQFLFDGEFNQIARLHYPNGLNAWSSSLSFEGDFSVAFNSGVNELYYFQLDREHIDNQVFPLHTLKLDADLGTILDVHISDDDLTVFLIGSSKTLVIPVWQIIEEVVGSTRVCPSNGCGDVALAEGVSPKTIPTESNEVSPIESVSPNYLGVGERIEVTISGNSFSPDSLVQIGDILIRDVNSVSETEIHFTSPVFEEGIYPVIVDGHQINAPSINVVDQQPIADYFWLLPGEYKELSYDPIHHVLLAADVLNSRIIKLNLNDNTIVERQIDGLTDLTLCPREDALFISSKNSIDKISIDNLAFVSTLYTGYVNSLDCVSSNNIVFTRPRDPNSPQGILFVRRLDISNLAVSDFEGYSYAKNEWNADRKIGVIDNKYVEYSSGERVGTGRLGSLFRTPTASTISPDGTKVYSIEGSTIHQIGLEAFRYPDFFSPVTIEIDSRIGEVSKMETSLDGNVLFFAGENGIMSLGL